MRFKERAKDDSNDPVTVVALDPESEAARIPVRSQVERMDMERREMIQTAAKVLADTSLQVMHATFNEETSTRTRLRMMRHVAETGKLETGNQPPLYNPKRLDIPDHTTLATTDSEEEEEEGKPEEFVDASTEMMDVSCGQERFAVYIHKADLAHLDGFVYSVHNILPPQSSGVVAYDGCDCMEFCEEGTCGCINLYGENYTDGGALLNPSFDRPIYECNAQCSCRTLCRNKLVSRGLAQKVRVQRSSTGCGLGLFADEAIQPNSFVIEYAGEIISTAEAKARWQMQEKLGIPNYIICIREHGAEGQMLRTNIDPRTAGNAARFINHSCEPNLAFVIVRTNNMIPHAALFSTRRIEQGEELFFAYGTVLPGESDAAEATAATRKPCHCGARSCAKYLPFDPWV
ncbi:hypothetical protein HDU96_001671 [Phlyctochytrium bullatum]|nr:hypothetical protein HDU96_001671 [Phlyctochytrium bullatum]